MRDLPSLRTHRHDSGTGPLGLPRCPSIVTFCSDVTWPCAPRPAGHVWRLRPPGFAGARPAPRATEKVVQQSVDPYLRTDDDQYTTTVSGWRRCHVKSHGRPGYIHFSSGKSFGSIVAGLA